MPVNASFVEHLFYHPNMFRWQVVFVSVRLLRQAFAKIIQSCIIICKILLSGKLQQ